MKIFIVICLLIHSVGSAGPFYLIAHMVNNRASLDWALGQGANAIENDFQFNSSGYPRLIEHGNPCDCICAILPGHVCHHGLNMKCSGSGASRNIIEHVEDVANRSGIALYYIDSKLDREIGELAGVNVIAFLDVHLFARGYQGNVLISTTEIDNFDYIQSAVNAASNSANRNRYYFTFDEEKGAYRDVISMLSRLTNQRIYSTGSSACLPLFYTDALRAAVNGKVSGENGLTLVWTIDLEINMKNLINLGVNGIMTNRVSDLKQVVQSLGLTLATPSTPISTSTVNIPSKNECSCSYEDGGCVISYPAPPNKACKCTKIFVVCVGTVVSCDTSHSKCANPDLSKVSCQLGNGNCNGY